MAIPLERASRDRCAQAFDPVLLHANQRPLLVDFPILVSASVARIGCSNLSASGSARVSLKAMTNLSEAAITKRAPGFKSTTGPLQRSNLVNAGRSFGITGGNGSGLIAVTYESGGAGPNLLTARPRRLMR